ncbi:MAG: multidrug effflux MFS transporter [Amphiplicatus sp.]
MKTDVEQSAAARLSFSELVALAAAAMALNALAIDMMLPALGVIGDELGAARDNDRQLVIIVYVLANGVAQLFFGPIVDRFGRRRVLLAALGGYIAGSVLSVLAGSFALLLAARAFQGVANAAARVAVIAIVRDHVSGRRMAEVMSIAMTIFMAAPILAPSLGQLILFVAPWRGIFLALLLFGLALAAWTAWRVPETLPKARRTPLDLRHILGAYGEFIRTRVALGYTLVLACAFGAGLGYISASEQVFVETFNLGAKFPIAFALGAGALACATLINARLVGRLGMRRLLHGAIIFFIIVNFAHLAVIWAAGDTLALFLLFNSASFFMIGLIAPNTTALALEPVGHIAGSASAMNGFATTALSGILGGLVAGFYDGTTRPIVTGYALLGLCALAIVLWTERGRLFEAREAS